MNNEEKLKVIKKALRIYTKKNVYFFKLNCLKQGRGLCWAFTEVGSCILKFQHIVNQCDSDFVFMESGKNKCNWWWWNDYGMEAFTLRRKILRGERDRLIKLIEKNG